MKVHRNPAWLNVLLSVLAIAVTLAIYLKTRPVKKLRVEVLSNSPLVSINTEMAKELQVLYRGVPVQSLSLILLKFTNAGTEPIEDSDYSEPIRVVLGPGATLGEVSIQESRPDGIQLSPTVVATNQVELARVLLNPDDQVVLRILALNNDSTLRITARIVGIRSLELDPVLKSKGLVAINNAVFVLGVLIGVLVFILVAYLIAGNRTIIRWRMRRFGFDPARHYYTTAQSVVLTLPASKDGVSATNVLAQVVSNLDRCLSWDPNYSERIRTDPLFSQLLSYERLKDVLDKHKANSSVEGDSPAN